MRKNIIVGLSVVLAVGLYAISSYGADAATSSLKQFKNKELGISFSYSSDLSFHVNKTKQALAEPSSYILKNAMPVLISIQKKGYTQDRNGTLMVFKKKLDDVLKGYKNSTAAERGLVKKKYGQNIWQKNTDDWGSEYYLQKKGKTYVLEVSSELTEKDNTTILKTLRINN